MCFFPEILYIFYGLSASFVCLSVLFADPLVSLADRLCVSFFEVNRQCKMITGEVALSKRKLQYTAVLVTAKKSMCSLDIHVALFQQL